MFFRWASPFEGIDRPEASWSEKHHSVLAAMRDLIGLAVAILGNPRCEKWCRAGCDTMYVNSPEGLATFDSPGPCSCVVCHAPAGTRGHTRHRVRLSGRRVSGVFCSTHGDDRTTSRANVSRFT